MDELLHQLKSALADEWLAHTEYNIVKVITRGRQRHSLVEILEELIKDEWDHINEISIRLQELNQQVIVDPRYWFKYSNAYVTPKKIETGYIADLTNQLEDMAITRYNDILKIEDIDTVTRVLVEEIISEETKHKYLITNFLQDLSL